MIFKTIFFFFFSAIAAYIPYLSLYLERAGIPGTQIGIILAISPAIRIVITPLWGMLADVKHWHRKIFIFCSLGAAVIAPFYIISSTFWAFIVVQVMFISLRAPLISIANKLALEVQRRQNFDFGKARIFGSIGFTIVAIIGGKIASIYGIQVLFIYVAFAFLLLAFLSRKLPQSVDTSATHLLKNLSEIGAQKTLIIFFVTTTLIRTASIVPTSYLSILLDHLGAGEDLTGIAWAIPAVIEIPIFYYSTKFLKKIGIKKTLFTGYLLTLLQVLFFNFAFHPALAILGQISRGLAFASYYIAGINYVDKKAPARVRTTCQTLFTAANIGVSAFLGNLIGGTLYENFGLYAMYKFSLIMVIAGIIIFYIYILNQKETEKAEIES